MKAELSVKRCYPTTQPHNFPVQYTHTVYIHCIIMYVHTCRYTVHACIHTHWSGLDCVVAIIKHVAYMTVVVSGLTTQCCYMCPTPPTWKRSVLGSWPYSVTVLLEAVLFMVTVWVDLRAKESMSCQCVWCVHVMQLPVHTMNAESVKYLHQCHTCIDFDDMRVI